MENISLNSTDHFCSLNTTYAVHTAKACLVLPLCFTVIYSGYQQWRERSSLTGISSLDCFTYNMVAMDLIWFIGSSCRIIGGPLQNMSILNVGIHIVSFSYYGECFFHVLASVERYLAVVHPINYMRFVKVKGQLYRNICITCVWLFISIIVFTIPHIPNMPLEVIFSFLILSLAVNSFCGLSIIAVLIRPRPGSVSSEKQKIDQKKKRALLNVLAIMFVLWLWLFGFLFTYYLQYFKWTSGYSSCVLKDLAYVFSIPSSTVLLLIYLYGKGRHVVKCFYCKF